VFRDICNRLTKCIRQSGHVMVRSLVQIYVTGPPILHGLIRWLSKVYKREKSTSGVANHRETDVILKILT